MDNTDIRRKVILKKTRFNSLTGETITVTRPKVRKRKTVVLSRGKGKKSIGNILLSRLVPFRFAIKTCLVKLGYNVSGLDFKTETALFYNEFAVNRYGRKSLNVSEFTNNVAFKLSPDDNINGDLDEARNRTAFLEITDVADSILNVFKGSRTKYETLKLQGLQPEKLMLSAELLQAKAVFIVQRRLTEKIEYDSFVKKNDVINLVFIGFLIYFIWIILS